MNPTLLQNFRKTGASRAWAFSWHHPSFCIDVTANEDGTFSIFWVERLPIQRNSFDMDAEGIIQKMTWIIECDLAVKRVNP